MSGSYNIYFRGFSGYIFFGGKPVPTTPFLVFTKLFSHVLSMGLLVGAYFLHWERRDEFVQLYEV